MPEGDWRELLEEPPRVLPHSSFWASTLNLSNAILGAGAATRTLRLLPSAVLPRLFR